MRRALPIPIALLLVSWLFLPRPLEVRRAVHVKRLGGPPEVSAFGAEVRPLFDRSPTELEEDRMQASLQSGEDMPDLTAWWRVVVSSGDAQDLVAQLMRDPLVQSAYVEPLIAPASFTAGESGESCPVQTPSYSPYQLYLAEAPAGINAPAAWMLPGGRGQGIQFADIEGGWNQQHEDLPGDRMEHVAGEKLTDRGWEAHGTAVIGVVAARDNGIGMVGIAPDVARIYTASLARVGVAPAIDRAQARLHPGDVLLIELHAVGPRNRWLPMEYWDDIFEVVKIATARGVVVVAAAGNGDEDLDHPAYDRRFDRSVRDSGAILVGAGAPARGGYVDRSRLYFSNYGSRVDVQGWGMLVATLDYGDLQNCGPNGRKYTNAFNGTSSASPVVAGAAILLESIYAARTGGPLAPLELRRILSESGSPQTDGPWGPKTQNIGPRPDLGRAVQTLGALLRSSGNDMDAQR